MEIPRPVPQTKFPENAVCVFKGAIFDVYQWEQKLFDGSVAVFEALKRPDTVEVVPITAEGNIVIIHEEQPAKKAFVGFPGGRVELGEDVIEAAKRELAEETGYTAGSIDLWYATQPVSKIDWAVYVLFAHGCVKKNSQSLDAGEKIETKEIDFNAFIELATGDTFPEAIRLIVAQATMDPKKMEELKKLFSPR